MPALPHRSDSQLVFVHTLSPVFVSLQLYKNNTNNYKRNTRRRRQMNAPRWIVRLFVSRFGPPVSFCVYVCVYTYCVHACVWKIFIFLNVEEVARTVHDAPSLPAAAAAAAATDEASVYGVRKKNIQTTTTDAVWWWWQAETTWTWGPSRRELVRRGVCVQHTYYKQEMEFTHTCVHTHTAANCWWADKRTCCLIDKWAQEREAEPEKREKERATKLIEINSRRTSVCMYVSMYLTARGMCEKTRPMMATAIKRRSSPSMLNSGISKYLLAAWRLLLCRCLRVNVFAPDIRRARDDTPYTQKTDSSCSLETV